MKKKTKLTLGILGAIGLATSTIIPTTVLLSSCSEDKGTELNVQTAQLNKDCLTNNSFQFYIGNPQINANYKRSFDGTNFTITGDFTNVPAGFAVGITPTYIKGMFTTDLDTKIFPDVVPGNVDSQYNATNVTYQMTSGNPADWGGRMVGLGFLTPSSKIKDGTKIGLAGYVLGNDQKSFVKFTFNIIFQQTK